MTDKLSCWCADFPKVSVGIPTYNRAAMLKRTVESVLHQDYQNIEIILSDNASTDQTKDVCQFYCEKYVGRIKYFQHLSNLGPTTNFSKVLEMASGEFFMWLGDDDWLDTSYVRNCLAELCSNPTLSLVSGCPQYYRNGLPAFEGKRFDLLYESWWLRVAIYYAKVADNGIFYGLMRTKQIKQINIVNTMGSDWHVIASLSSMGKMKTIPEIFVHRELGGATISYHQIAHSLGLSKFQAVFPILSTAFSAWGYIVIKGTSYHSRSVLKRLVLGSVVFGVILLKHTLRYFIRAVKVISK